jgi:pantoate--beta-alanine ligase
LVVAGERSLSTILGVIRDELARQPLVKAEYVSAVDMVTLQPVAELQGEVLVALAARVGRARLIDNAVVRIRDGQVDVEL